MNKEERKNFESIRDNVHSEPMTQVEVMKLALETLEEINKLSIGENAIFLPAEIDTAMDALRQAIEQKQEPVGFMCQGCFYELDDVDKYCEMEHVYLYTHPSPPQRQPLTDEEMEHIWKLAQAKDWGWEQMFRAIESAHGIKVEA